MKNWFRILKIPGVAPLVAGNSIFRIAKSSLVIIFSLLIVSQESSALQVGALDLTIVLPVALFSPFAGLVVDRFQTKRLLVVCSVLISLFLLPVTWVSQSTPVVLITSIFVATVGSFFIPAFFSITPRIVQQEDLLVTNSLVDLFSMAASILAGILSSWLFQTHGAGLALLFCIVLFLVSAACFVKLKFPPGEEKQSVPEDSRTLTLEEGFRSIRQNLVKDFIEGLRLIINLKWLRFWTFVFIALGISDAFFYPYLVVWAKRELVLLDTQYGLLNSMISLGSALGIVILIPFLAKKKPDYALVVLLAAMGGILISLRFQKMLWPVILLLLLFGMLRTSTGLLVTTETQKHTPAEVRGRIMGTYQSIGEGAYALTVAIAGLLIDRTGAATFIFLAGVVFLITCICVIGLIRRSEKPEEIRPQ